MNFRRIEGFGRKTVNISSAPKINGIWGKIRQSIFRSKNVTGKNLREFPLGGHPLKKLWFLRGSLGGGASSGRVRGGGGVNRGNSTSRQNNSGTNAGNSNVNIIQQPAA